MSQPNKWKPFALAGWGLLALTVLVLGLSSLDSRSGGGQYKESPDGTAEAHLESYRHTGPLVRDNSVWIEMYVLEKNTGPDWRNFKRHLVSYNSGNVSSDEMVARILKDPITWSTDSKRVKFVVGKTEISIER